MRNPFSSFFKTPFIAAHGTAGRAVMLAFATRILSAAIAFFSQIFMARFMGASDYGLYVYVWVWVLILGQISNFGLASSAQKFIPTYISKHNEVHLRGFLSGARLIGFGLACLICAVGLLVLWQFGTFIKSPLIIPLYLALFCLPAFVLTDIQDGISRSFDWTILALGPPYIIRPLLILALLLLGHAFGLDDNAVSAMGASLVATWLTAFIQFMRLRDRLKHKVSEGPKKTESIVWLKTALPIVLVEGFFLLLTHCDVLVLEQFRDSREVAIYWASLKTLALVPFVFFAVSSASTHRFAALFAKGERAELEIFANKTARWTFIPSVAAVIVLALIGPWILRLFGADFTEGYPVLIIMAVGLLARAAIGPSERLLSMVGEQMTCAKIYALCFVLNLTLAFVLVPHFGMIGAALATAGAMVAETLFLMVSVRQKLGFSVFVLTRAAP